MRQNFCDGWLFCPEPAGGYPVNRHIYKNGDSKGFAAEKFPDGGWKPVTLPHDWCYGLDQDPAYANSFGHYKLNVSDLGGMDPLLLPQDRGTPIGWYRKHFRLPEEMRNQLVFLNFEGVFRDWELYVNGTFLGRHLSGYTGKRFEISDVLSFGDGENVIAVRVDATQNEGWYYEGAGIYRNVYLEVKPRVSVCQDSVWIQAVPIWENGDCVKGEISVSCTVRNETGTEQQAEVCFRVGTERTAVNLSVPPFSAAPVSAGLEISGPELWSPDAPFCYQLEAAVKSAAGADTETSGFGFRTIRFDPDHGFFLNGKHTAIRGVCLHQDFACVGAALPDELHIFKIRRLREMGCNAVRTAHHPPAPEFLDACDRLGMLVMDETRMFGSSEEALSEMRETVRRDRNHPSVILWSIGNEEMLRQNNAIGRKMASRMIREIRALDTRPVTYGGNNGGQYAGINETVDVRGFNYLHIQPEDYLEAYHAAHPQQPILGSEEGSAFYNRGEVCFDREARTVGGYDDWMAPWGSSAEGWLRYCAAHSYIAGAFLWTGFDYSGEPTPFHHNTVTSFGAIDLCGYPKDIFYYYRSWWRTEDELYLYPDWNREIGQTVRVVAYSNLEEVALFLNGRPLGRKRMEPLGHLEWLVPFEPGTLEAVGYRDGKEAKRYSRVTTGAPDRLDLKLECEPGNSGTALVTARILDRNGNVVPYGDSLITWTADNGQILGVGNGDPKSYERNQFPEERIRRRLDHFQRKENGTWTAYDVCGAADPAAFQAPSMDTAYPEPVRVPFCDAKRIVLNRPQRTRTTSSFRCTFTDEGGAALLTFERVEGRMKLILNGEVITDDTESGWPQSFRVTTARGTNELTVILSSYDGKEALKGGAFLDRFRKPDVCRRAFHGLCMAAVCVGKGQTRIGASAPGLGSAELWMTQ